MCVFVHYKCCQFRLTNLVNVPVAELSWYVNLMSVFIHGEVEVSAESLQPDMVPVLVIKQATQRNKKLPARG